MKKQLFTVIAAGLTALSLTACGGSTTAATTAPKEEVVLGRRWWVPGATEVAHSAQCRGPCEQPREGRTSDLSCSQLSAQCLERGRCPKSVP